jgi:hypothetical protein
MRQPKHDPQTWGVILEKELTVVQARDGIDQRESQPASLARSRRSEPVVFLNCLVALMLVDNPSRRAALR